MFAELLAQPGVVEELELRSTVGFLAFHGGSLEQGTDDIAREAASRSGASFYAVVQPHDLRWHVPSKLFDPAVSPALRSFIDHVDVAIAVHGFGREGLFTSLLVGGSNRDLAVRVATSLRRGLAPHGYDVIDDVNAIPSALRGLHPHNPVNRPRMGGVQLELPPRVRGLGPFWAAPPHEPGAGSRASTELTRTPHTEALIEALRHTATAWTRGAD